MSPHNETPVQPHASTTHLLLIPSYNTGPQVYETVRSARAQWNPVWVVTDGSNDGTPDGLRAMAHADPGLRLIELPTNGGKGTTVLHGLLEAQAAGFTHALTMDSDGQHPADLIPLFMQTSAQRPTRRTRVCVSRPFCPRSQP